MLDTINWLEEVEKRQDDLLADLFRLLKIDSVRDDEAATEEAPVGPGPLRALEEFLAMAEEDGFSTQQFGPWAGRVELGQGDELMGILGHVDVVPAGSGWETDPFEPVLKDGRIYARGSSDDKGPTVAAYFALKILRELGVEFNKRIHLIVGTDEESGWQCMDYYFQHAEMPDFGFSPDAMFPIINGEKGNVSSILTQPASQAQGEGLHLASFKSGLRPNMVPEDAVAVLDRADQAVEEAFQKYSQELTDITGSSEWSGDQLKLSLVGKSAHGSTPEKGLNSATYLASFLTAYSYDQDSAQAFLEILAGPLHENFNAAKLGADHHDEVMGDVSMNVGIANYSDQAGMTIDCNFRYPKGTDGKVIQKQMQEALPYEGLSIEMGEDKEPHYVPADDPLVKTLLEVYEDHTGFEGHEVVIGGGTYARLMPRGVAYGALMPDSIDTMHQANEFLTIEDLVRATAIYADAIYRLTR